MRSFSTLSTFIDYGSVSYAREWVSMIVENILRGGKSACSFVDFPIFFCHRISIHVYGIRQYS